MKFVALLLASAMSTTSARRTGADVTRTDAALFREFPDIRDEVISIVVDGDRVAVRFMTSGHRGKTE